ncbi:phospholipase A-2-activating protein [Nematocida sp. LUAm3]|nr:phospholipase A-2-activating protein [Nematocida sp. LUAm3]KAI5174596.1 phospholipase A-2-activating protein [Nematocida sp. LUAm2]KAI5177998.1 phospholipase A-2-activating protein [Nematocida sp. LUAm1]
MKIEVLRQIHKGDIKECIVEGDLLFTCGRDNRVVMSYFKDISPICTTEDLGCFINSMYVYGDTLYAGGHNGTVFLLRVDGKSISVVDKVMAHGGNVCSIRGEGERVVSASWDGSVCIWENKRVKESVYTDKSIWAAEYLKGEEIVACCTDGSIIYLNKKNEKYVVSRGLLLHDSCIRDIIVEKDRIITLSNSGVLIATEHSGRVIKKVSLDAISFRIKRMSSKGSTELNHGVTGGVTTELNHIGMGGVTEGTYGVFLDEGVVKVLDGEMEYLYAISLPVLSCWSGCLFPEELVIGASDGNIYKFGGEENVKAKEYLEGLHEQMNIPQEEEKAYKVEDGKVFERKGERGEWELFGEQVDGQKKKYDHTINIELGSKVFKLSFNQNDEYSSVSKEFVSANGLSEEYVPEIIEFLEKNFKRKNNVDITNYTLYSSISYEGVSKKFEKYPNGERALEILLKIFNGSVKSGSEEFSLLIKEIEVILSEWILGDYEKYPVLDCYKYLLAVGGSFDFYFMKNLEIFSDKRDALLYAKLATNILACSFKDKKYVVHNMNRILDKNLVDNEVIRHYKKNLHRAEEK